MLNFLNGRVRLHEGDCLDVIRTMPDYSFDSVVTDPPYALVSIVKRFGKPGSAPAKGDVYARASSGFMGQQWDTGERAFSVEFWSEVLRVLKPGGHVVAASGTRTYHRLACAIEDAGFEIRDMVSWLYGSGFPKSHNQGNGWGTALKPACEPWVLARKPIVGTVAANVQAYGTGAINIDATRVGERWPANVIHDGSEEVVGLFPHLGKTAGSYTRSAHAEGEWLHAKPAGSAQAGFGDSGSAARFFYTAKADADCRAGSKHPTVKPVDLMQYLCRLVTPPRGVVLDPFAGSGTTGEAAYREGFSAVLIERESAYCADIKRRMALVLGGPDERRREILKAKGQADENAGPLFEGLS